MKRKNYTNTPKTEREIQKNAVRKLRDLGFTVIITSNKIKTANTRGTPDLFVYLKRSMWIALDAKTEKGKLTEEQEELRRDGKIFVFRDEDEAVDICVMKLNYLV